MQRRNLITIIAATALAIEVSASSIGDAPTVHPDSLVGYARQYIGTPYGYGQRSGKRFDCSGFTSYVFEHYGYKLARSSRDQYLEGDSVERGEWTAGDLVFFSGRSGGQSRVGHVGIVVDSDGEKFSFIHASTSRGVIVSHSTERYYSTRYIGARRVLPPYESIALNPYDRPMTEYEKIFGRIEFRPIPDLIRPHEFPIKKAKKRRRR